MFAMKTILIAFGRVRVYHGAQQAGQAEILTDNQ
jgi:hypothetical protein